jgi:FtsH-binding integral membrane protein
METSLYFKTALILSIQLGIVFIGCFYFLKRARQCYMDGLPLFGIRFIGKKNSRGELDLIPIVPEPIVNASPSVKAFIKKYDSQPTPRQGVIIAFTWVWALSLVGMVFIAPTSTAAGIILMTITSITFAPLLGIIMLEMDENDGLRAVLLTCFITVATALVGMYAGIDFTFMRGFLFYGLCALIVIGLFRMFFGMTSAMVRAKAIAGAMLFSLLLVYDFNRLKQLNDIGVNEWPAALDIAISLYLDIMNLLLDILELMANG